MADERLVTVKSSGGDYTSLAAAIAGEAGDLVAADEWLHVECYAMQDTSQVAVTGYTTNASCYIKIDTPLSERHQGVWDTNKYCINRDTYSTNLTISVANVLVEGLQSRNLVDEAFRLYGSIANVRLSKCIGISDRYIAFFIIGAPATVTNCLSVGSDRGFYIRGANSAYNCTAVNTGRYGFYTAYVTTSIYNCLSYNSGMADFAIDAGTPVFTLNNCASSDGTADDFAGGNNRVNQTFSFRDAAHGDYHLAENDTGARGYGAVNPGSGLYLDDVDGQLRGASWDIGFDQYVSSGPEPEGKMQKWYYHTQTMRG